MPFWLLPLHLLLFCFGCSLQYRLCLPLATFEYLDCTMRYLHIMIFTFQNLLCNTKCMLVRYVVKYNSVLKVMNDRLWHHPVLLLPWSVPKLEPPCWVCAHRSQTLKALSGFDDSGFRVGCIVFDKWRFACWCVTKEDYFEYFLSLHNIVINL